MPRQVIEEFKELYRRHYGVELTDTEAEATGLRPENLAIWQIYPPCATARVAVEVPMRNVRELCRTHSEMELTHEQAGV